MLDRICIMPWEPVSALTATRGLFPFRLGWQSVTVLTPINCPIAKIDCLLFSLDLIFVLAICHCAIPRHLYTRIVLLARVNDKRTPVPTDLTFVIQVKQFLIIFNIFNRGTCHKEVAVILSPLKYFAHFFV